MYEKTPYTPGFREVVKLAKAEAGRLGHDYVGPEHYLLGILRKGNGIAIEILKELQVDLRKLRQDVEELSASGSGPAINLFAPNEDARRALDATKEAARELRQNWYGTEHLLLGMAVCEESEPARCLAQLGIQAEHVRAALLRKLENDGRVRSRRYPKIMITCAAVNWLSIFGYWFIVLYARSSGSRTQFENALAFAVTFLFIVPVSCVLALAALLRSDPPRIGKVALVFAPVVLWLLTFAAEYFGH